MGFEELRPGDVVAGKYRVRSILSDRRGQLVEAFHTEFDQRVVIRVISPQIANDKEIERFRRESKVLAKLQSEHAARIIDVGTQPDGSFYLVRQYLEGRDLRAVLDERGPLPIGEAVHFVMQAAEAVAETHAHGILLRELSTSHLMLTRLLGGDEQIKIIDFGTAKLLRDDGDRDHDEVTTTTMFGLSPYSSPELIRKDKNIDHRTDVWSLGAILYELLCGRPPFDGELARLMLQITKEDPPPLNRLRRDVPPTLVKVISRALTKPVSSRLADVHQLAKALLPFAPVAGTLLTDRIGKLDAERRNRAPSHRGAADDEEVEISQIEEVLVGAPSPYERRTDEDDDPTRVGFSIPMRANAVPSTIPETGDDEQTETLTKPVRRKTPPKRVAPPRPPAPKLARLRGGEGAEPSPPKERPKPPRKVSQEKTEQLGRSFVPPSAGPTRDPVFAGAAASLGEPPAVDDHAHGAAPPSSRPIPSSERAGWPATGHRIAGDAHAPTTLTATPPGLRGDLMGDFRGKTTGARKAVVGFIAACCVLLPALLGLMFFQDAEATREEEARVKAERSEREANGAASAGQGAEGAPTAKAPEPTPIGDIAPPVKVEIVDQSDPAAPKSPIGSPPPVGFVPPPKPAPPSSAPPPPKESTPSGDNGTLVAIAVGGTCAFSVNGAPKGTTTTLKLPLKPGTYSVTCKPATGASKSRSVRIEGGATAMAMFKL